MFLDLKADQAGQRIQKSNDKFTMALTDKSNKALTDLLKQRLQIIADHVLRDADPEKHLEALREVSESIDRLRTELHPELPPRLRHFLEQSSYQKALSYLEEMQERA